jgi:signal transduction histidine kinase/CheY-like chemotaxis protein
MRRRHIEEIRRLREEFDASLAARFEDLAKVNRLLEDGNVELNRANRMKSEFLADVSEELRAPLNEIIGSSKKLLGSGRTASEEERIRCAEEIHASARHLHEIVSDVHELSRIEAGEMTLQLESFPVEDVAEEALIRVSPDAKAKGIDITARYAEDLPRIQADPSKLKQILYNLLSNAVKFTPGGGRVDLSVETRGGEFTFAVSDTGIGVAPEDHDRIFSRFMRLDGSYARRYQGTGLGLALVKCYVEMHGGRIWVDSRPASGSRFSFSMPLRGAGVHPDRTLPPVAWEPGEGSSSGVRSRALAARTILVVEDNPLNMKLVRDVLRQRGHCVIEAVSGREALVKARGASVDLILMDLELPDMDGLEATQWLKADPATRHIPTVALSARAEKGDDERVLAAGCCGHIAEPVDATNFPAIVESYLRN